MSNVPYPLGEQPPIVTERKSNVVLGNQSFLSVLLRSTAGELYKIRRRLMSKILLLIGVGLIILLFSFQALALLLSSNYSSSTMNCTGDGQTQTCTRVQMPEQERQRIKEMISRPLRLPSSFTSSVGAVDFVGLILLVILVSAIVGGEYGTGTIRLMLTRGPTRTQFFIAKILAMLVSILLTLLILVPLGIIVAALYNLATGIAFPSFLTGEWVGHAVLYLLIAALGLFVYAMLAQCLSTLGRATAAGIAGALVWWLVESILGSLLLVIGTANPGSFGDFLKSIPDYFISNNWNALLNHQSAYLLKIYNTGQGGSSPFNHDISDVHALIVLAVYLVVLIGVSWWVMKRRDITN